MKPSNLALRLEPEAEQEPATDIAPAEATARATRRLERTRRLGLEYRAIVIRDDGMRLFGVR